MNAWPFSCRQTVSKLTRDLDEVVRQSHQARLEDHYAYLFLDGVSLRVRRPTGRKRVQMLVAYGVRRDSTRHLLAFLRSQGESQADWEGLLQDMYGRGLEGEHLSLIVTDGCPGLAAAIRTVYPRVRHLMLKVWLYAYALGITSARRVEQRIHEDLGLRYLAGGARPDNWALSAFRRRHARGLNDVFTQVLEMVRQMKLALSKTIRTRVTSPAGSERELALLSSCARCSGLSTDAAFGRPLAIGTSIVHQRRLFSLQY